MKEKKRAFLSLGFLQTKIRRCRLRLIKTEGEKTGCKNVFLRKKSISWYFDRYIMMLNGRTEIWILKTEVFFFFYPGSHLGLGDYILVSC